MSEYRTISSCVERDGIGEVEITQLTPSDFRMYIRQTEKSGAEWEVIREALRTEWSYRFYPYKRQAFSIDFRIRRTKKGCKDSLPIRALANGLFIIELILNNYNETKGLTDDSK